MYVGLHNRSSYSFGSSLIPPEQLAAFAAHWRMPAVAMTNVGGLYGAVRFQGACTKAGIKPIFGAELLVRLESTSHSPKRERGSGVAQASRLRGAETRAGRPCHTEAITVLLLAQTLGGYGNLCRLISRHQLTEAPLTLGDLGEYAGDLVCLVGRPSPHAPHPSPLAPRPSSLSAQHLLPFREIFGDRLYVELCIHRAEDVPIARRRARVADDAGVPVVATGESRCLRRDQMPLLRALASVGTLTLLDRPHPDKPEGLWHLRTPAEMLHLFRRRPEALENTMRIAESCNVTLDVTRNRFPTFMPHDADISCGTGILPVSEDADGDSAVRLLRELCLAGCRRRYIETPPMKGIGGCRPDYTQVLARLDRELSVIEQVHYAEYFLVFHEIVQYCRREGIATLARGSAADSLVCYALGVSEACPFRFDLPFDRFINPERAKFSKMADIDLDLPWDRRDEVINWVYDRWGHDRVAMIGSANTFHARAAVAELGKVYGLPPHEVYRATKLLPHVSADSLPHTLASAPETREIPTQEEPYRTIIQLAVELEDLPRHWAMHPCGIVVSPEPLTDLVPVQRSPKGPLIAQYDMDEIEELGFIKIDLLGQAGLSVLRDAVAEIGRTEGVTIDLDRDVDYSDAVTWDLIAGGQARGVHHIESPAMTSLLVQSNCRDIDCLTTIVALIRPGAANQGKKEVFCRRHQGFEPATFVHPAVVPVLESTYGLMVFEEHILQIAVEFAGMNVGRADVLRRALNKEDRRLVAEMKGEFFAHARRRGHGDGEIQAVWGILDDFAGFMFNKAHSAEYALEAFQGAWLKRRWPAHYIAAVLSNYRGFYAHSPTLPQILYVMEALRLGVGFRPPCVNRSREHFSVESESEPASVATGLRAGRALSTAFIRVPISHIQGLSAEFAARWWAERQKAAFATLDEFLERCRPGDADARLLLDTGALDGFGIPRPAMFWELRDSRDVRREAWLAHRFSGGAANLTATPPVALTPPDEWQIARREMELLGFPITLPPLTCLGRDDRGRDIDWSRYVPAGELATHIGKRVQVCGIMVADRINATTRGDLMKFVTLADRTGFVEAHLFPDVYRKLGYLTAAHPILAAAGVVEPFENGRGFTLRVTHLAPPTKK